MKKELNTTEQHFATTRSEAERIVEQARDEEKSNLTSQKLIVKPTNTVSICSTQIYLHLKTLWLTNNIYTKSTRITTSKGMN